jgi:hypothetical protein
VERHFTSLAIQFGHAALGALNIKQLPVKTTVGSVSP